jgi:hypothetical protein
MRALPVLASGVVLVVAAAGMAARHAWPNPTEISTLVASFACVWGALSLRSAKARIGCAVVWAGVMIERAARIVQDAEPSLTAIDFAMFYTSAGLLSEGSSPYLLRETGAFPFPVLPLVRALSLGGTLSVTDAFVMFLLVQGGLLGVGLILLFRSVTHSGALRDVRWEHRVLAIATVLHPAVMDAVVIGQTTLVAGSLLMFALWFWRCGDGRRSLHAAAITMSLVWMIKPQLMMAVAFFVVRWLLDRSARQGPTRAGEIGRLIPRWSMALVAMTLPVWFPAFAIAYWDFFAVGWHFTTQIAEAARNNYAPAAILAKALARTGVVTTSEALPLLTLAIAGGVVAWNVASLVATRADSLRTCVPWLLGALLWSSLTWEFYLSFALSALVILMIESRGPALLALGLALTTVFSSFAFTVGVLLVYFHSHAVLAHEARST